MSNNESTEAALNKGALSAETEKSSVQKGNPLGWPGRMSRLPSHAAGRGGGGGSALTRAKQSRPSHMQVRGGT